MAIKLQCNSCGRKIEAPDNAGGKWGKCPGCHTKIYVPLPATEDDELKLAPIDETEEQKRKQLMLETFQVTQHILEEQAVPDSPTAGVGPSPEISEETLTNHIIDYLQQMANGELDTAQRTADLVVPHRRKAMAILDEFARNYPPDPALEDIPQRVLSGLIRNLRTRLS